MISICIATYNRYDTHLKNNIDELLKLKNVSEIIITDDNSGDYEKLINEFDDEKLKVYKNNERLYPFKNKYNAVSKATNDYVILLDSDNLIDQNFIDNLLSIKDTWNKDILIQPKIFKFNKKFDFIKNNDIIDKTNIKDYFSNEENLNLDISIFGLFLNMGNFFVNKQTYVDVFDNISLSIDPYASDVIMFLYYWIKNDKKIIINDELTYRHQLYSDSFFNEYKDFSIDIINQIKNNIINDNYIDF